MSAYQTTFLGRTKVADGTMAFRFEKPKYFTFKAGQYVDLTISDPEHGSSTHTVSIASSPLDDDILVATRMRNTLFKQSLAVLPIGSEAQIDGPMGSLRLHNNTAKATVFLAGGIGIAPFLSMLAYATREKFGHPLLLFYANRQLKDAAFIEVLWKLERANPRFRFVPTLTRLVNSSGGWKGGTGHISSALIRTQVGVLRGPIYYIAGPPAMVAAANQTLVETGVDEDDIRTEEFAGY